MPNQTQSIPLTAGQEFWRGVGQELPLMLGVVPFGMVFGVLGLASGLTALQTVLLSLIVFGGASQVVFVQLWATGVPPAVVGTSVSVVNLRHVLYSASIAQYFRTLPLVWRIPLAYLLTDEAYAVTITRLRNEEKSLYQHYHLLGTGITLWLCWQISTIIGVLFGATLPQSWPLDFVIPLTFIALVAPAIRQRADLVACISAAVISIVAQPLPWKSWIIVAAVGGIVAGYMTKVLTANEVIK
jgi:4-azaleucine resistance transporter AzlC